MYICMLFVLILFALVTQREPSLQWNMGLCAFFTLSWLVRPRQMKCICNVKDSTYITLSFQNLFQSYQNSMYFIFQICIALMILNWLLGLYSTATQKHSRWGAKYSTFLLPNARNTNMLVSWSQREPFLPFTRRVLPDAKPNICILPDTKPKCKPVEYRLNWVPGAGSLRWACTFHIFCVDFICVG